MGVTKRAKSVEVFWCETKEYYPVYVCPSCKVEHHGGFGKKTTRFICSCGQELIVRTIWIKESKE